MTSGVDCCDSERDLIAEYIEAHAERIVRLVGYRNEESRIDELLRIADEIRRDQHR